MALITAYGLFGISAAVAVAILALLPMAWAFDNESGTFLILATLFVITIGSMVMLITLMAISH